MSSQIFTLEYQVKLTGGSQAASQMNGVNSALKMNSTVTTQAAKSQKVYGTAMDETGKKTGKTAQQTTQATRSFRGLVFGLTGLTSSLVEALGMWGIYSDSAARVEDATKRVEEATAKYGATSKEARDATQELSNAERAMNMVRRNTILSFFDMVTWITLTVNGIQKLRSQGVSLGSVFTSITGVFNRFRTAAVAPAVTDMARLGTTFTTFKTAAVAPMMTSLTTLSGGFKGVATSARPLGVAVPALATSMTGLSTSFKATAASATPLGAMIGTVGTASVATAGKVGILSGALQFLKANIRGVLIATGIGAVIVALGFLAEHFINASEATKEAAEQITDSTEEIKSQIGSWNDVTAAATGDIHNVLAESGKDMDEYTKNTLEDIEKQIAGWKKLPQEVALSLAQTRKAQLQSQLDIAKQAQTAGIGTQSFLDVITGKKSIIEPARNEQHIKTLEDAIAGLDKNINAMVVDMENAAKTTENLGLSGTQTGKILGNIFGANLLEMAKGAEQFKITMTDVQNVLNTLPASKLPEFLKLLENSLESMASAAGLEGVAKETFIEFWKDWIEQVEDAIGVTEKEGEKLKEVKEDFASLHPEMNAAIESTLGLASGTDELKNKYNELNAEVSKFMDTSGLSISQLEAMLGIHDDLIGSIQAQADSIKNNIIYWDRLTDATFQTALANQEYIFGQIKITEILENSRKNQLLFNQAMIEGRTALRDFVTDTQLAIIRDKEFETGLRALVAAQTDVRLPTQLTIDQLKELQIELQKGGTGATIFAEAFDEILAPLQRFSEISAELAKGGKDSNKNFKEALKGLEIPKGLRKQYDDLLRDLAKLQEAGTKVNDTFQVLSHLELKGTAENFDSFIRTIEKGIQKMADIDPDVEKFADFMDPIFDSLKDMPDEQRQQTLLALGNVWEELFGPNGTFMDEDVTKSDVAYGIEKITEALNNMSDVDIAGISGPLDQLAVSIEGLQEAQSKFVADKNFKSTVEAYAALSEGGIIKFPEPPDVQQTLSDNMGNLVTSTDNLKSSIDALASKIGTSGIDWMVLKNLLGGGGFSNIDIPFKPFDQQGDSPPGGFDKQGRPLDREGNVIEEKKEPMVPPEFAIWSTFFEQIKTGWNEVVMHVTTLTTTMGTSITTTINAVALSVTIVWQTMAAAMVAFIAQASILIQAQFTAMAIFWGVNLINMSTALATATIGWITMFQIMVITANVHFQSMATFWGAHLINMATAAATATTGILQMFQSMASSATSVFSALASHWSAMMNSFINNAKSATNSASSAFQSMVSKATSVFNKLASNWSSTMNKMVSAAKSAVSKILSQINKLNTTVTTTHIIKTKKVNAARGFQGVVSNPTTFNVAEGGKPEFVSVTPLKDFTGRQTVASNMNITGKKSGGMSEQQPILVQVFLDGEQIKGHVVKAIVTNQGAFK